MRAPSFLLLAGAAIGIAGLVQPGSPAAAPASPAKPAVLARRTAIPASDCNGVADAILEAANLEANADYWLDVATCLNEPPADLDACLAEADARLQEALVVAQDEHDARIDICNELGGATYDPDIDPSEFSITINNRYFPLVPGRLMVYEKKLDSGKETTEFRVGSDTVVIDGFTCRAVRDTVKLPGDVLVEDTTDWYAQRSDGTVWYFGEVARNYVDGFLDNLDGSWRTGKHEAKAGIVMEASPAVDDFYRQEYLANEAEDVARVVSLDESVSVPYGKFKHCIKTEESNPFHPGHLTWKYYALDVGLVLEVDVDTGERTELVKIKK